MTQEWKEAVDYIEQGKEEELLDIAKVEERQMQPANAILNRTNFYDLMASFTEHPTPQTMHVLLSPQVHRDLSIFDAQALHRAIHASFSMIEYPLPGYLPSPVLWFYTKRFSEENAGRRRFVKNTMMAKLLTCSLFFIYLLFLIGLGMLIATERGVLILIDLVLLLFIVFIVMYIRRHKDMEEYDLAFLQDCPMIDYLPSIEDRF